MFCDHCGWKLRENAAFCPKCGTAVKLEEAEETKDQYTSLVPDPKDNDESKPVSERVKDIKKPLFKDEGDTYAEPKKSRKKLIITLSVCLAAVIAIGVIVLLIINQPAVTLDSAYNKYIELLEKDKDQIGTFSQSNGSKNIAILEDGETDIPCVLYITYDNKNVPVLHTLFAKDKSIRIDSNAEYAGYAVVQREKMTFFKVASDDHIYFWLGKSLWQLDKIDGKPKFFAQSYSSNNNEIRYTVLENGEEKTVTEKEYNDFIAEYHNNAETIIVSALPDDQIKQVFPNIRENLSMDYETAMAFLHAKKTPFSNNSNEGKNDYMETANTDVTEKPTEPPTEPPKAEDFIKIYQEDTYYNKIRKNDFTYVMPLFAIDSPDAEAINNELISAYEEALKSINAYITDPYNDGIYTVNYEAWINDNILSLCVERKLAVSVRYLVYNIDIFTGKRIDNEEIAQHYGTTFSDMFENVRTAVDSAFTEKFKQNSDSILAKYRQKTIADENIDQSVLFIKDGNRLFVMYEWFMAVQAAHGHDIAEMNI